MYRKKGFTLLELIIVILTICILLAILYPVKIKAKKIAQRIICGTNLQCLGTAMVVYANDYNDNFPQLGKGTWAKELGYSFEDNEFNPFDYEGSCTITSSLYLLIREADVSPKSFICPESNQTEFDGRNSKNLDIVELWDFGSDPYPHVSYAYHNPYGQFPPNFIRIASFAIAADMNPWMLNGDFVSKGASDQPPQIIDVNDPETWKRGNATPHRSNKTFEKQEGQNILFGDGHVSFENQPNVGVKNDNIYTFWSTEEDPTKQDRQGGTAPTNRSAENDAKSSTDSFLAI
jgi:prepilin-type N-terminal cleavage/methylation domain-containing protein/prepilin-type processing-associated H-X9-DG protein